MSAVPLRHTAPGHYDRPYDVKFTPRYGWTKNICILDDHRCFKLFPQFVTWKRDDHVRESGYALRASLTLEASYIALVHDALATYGSDGPLISGIVRDHFPIEVKDLLRSLAMRQSRLADISVAHWLVAGRRITTWRNARHQMEKERAK